MSSEFRHAPRMLQSPNILSTKIWLAKTKGRLSFFFFFLQVNKIQAIRVEQYEMEERLGSLAETPEWNTRGLVTRRKGRQVSFWLYICSHKRTLPISVGSRFRCGFFLQRDILPPARLFFSFTFNALRFSTLAFHSLLLSIYGNCITNKFIRPVNMNIVLTCPSLSPVVTRTLSSCL